QALQAADEAKDNLSDVLMMVGDKEELIMEIDNVLVSKDFIEGLHGKALYEGEYVEFDKIVKLKKLQDMTVKAETFKELGELDRAIDCYEEARLFATFKGLDSHAKDLQQEISNLRLGEALVEAKSAEGEKNWRDAAEIYKKALDVAHSVSGAGSDEEQRVINQYLTVALFRYQIEQSKQIFADENWREAVDVLSQAEKVIRENQAMITPEEKEEFERLYVHARFYLMLYTAKKAYEQGNWDTAIENYNIGLRLLQEKGQYFGDELLASKKKVGKTMLMTKVARELSLAAICENQDDPSGAIAYYYHVIKMLTDNSIGNDKEFKRVIDNTRLQIDATENRKIIKEKVAWLKKNYVNIFKKHYPSANVLFLLYPEVTLIKKEHDKMVFHMSCVEKSNGRSFRLVLDYVNMLKTNDWNLYAGK
ncbi:MAG: hypothetical protein OEM02_14610, partial [Desulfobulbaceae bacterium]|nr:hypothetical protein [Desulfobulbaceae bacterium]